MLLCSYSQGVADEEVEKRNKRKFEAVEEVQDISEDDESAGLTVSQARTMTEETSVQPGRKKTEPQARSTLTVQDSLEPIPPSSSSGQNLSTRQLSAVAAYPNARSASAI